MSTKTALVLIAGFVAGCGAAAIAPLVIPPANAQTTTRWETFCRSSGVHQAAGTAEELTSIGNAAGAEGWELVSTSISGAPPFAGVACFKRPAP